MLANAAQTTAENLTAEVQRLHDTGWRLVTYSAVDLGPEVEVIYHFDKDLELKHLRLTCPKGGRLPSMSGIYLAAFLVENEIADQFGLGFDGLVIDYQGTLFLEEGIKPVHICNGVSAVMDPAGEEA